MSDVHSTGALRNCRDDGRCQYAIDHGAEGLGHCSPKCVMPRDQVGALRQQPEAVDHDRELLELAALATGIVGRYFKGDNPIHTGIYRAEYRYYWNPRISNSEALQLAVNLGFSIHNNGMRVAVSQGNNPRLGYLSGWIDLGLDDEAAVRLAIVRAAAQIGSELRKTASGSHQEARSNEQGEST